MADVDRELKVRASFEDRASLGVKAMAGELEKASRAAPALATQFDTLGRGATIAGRSVQDFGRATQSLKAPAIDPLVGGFAALPTHVDKSTQSLGGFNAAMLKSVAAYAGLTLGASTAARFLASSVREFAEAEAAAVRLGFALENNTRTRGTDLNSINAWIQATSKSRVVDDETVSSLTALAVTMGRTTGEAQRLVEVAIDLGVATDRDAQTGLLALIKAMEGQDRQLRMMIPELGEFTEAQLALGAATEDVAARVGPAAEQMANTTEASLRRMGIWLDETKEKLGAFGVKFAETALISIGIRPGAERRFGTQPGDATQSLASRTVSGGAVSLLNPDWSQQMTEEATKAAEASKAVAAAHAELVANELELIRIIPEATIAMMRVAEVAAPNIGPGTEFNPFANPNFSRIGTIDGRAPGDFSRFIDRTPELQGPAPWESEDMAALEQGSALLRDTTAAFFSSVASGWGRAITDADSFFEVVAEGFRETLQQAVGELISSAIRSSIPGAGLLPLSGGSARDITRASIARELSIGQARGHIR